MKPLRRIFFTIGVLILSITINSCDKENTTIIPEAAKNIAGVWKIAAVSRNGVDITDNFDFSQFSIEFKTDGSYSISNLVPFVISKNGKWMLDDASNPLHLSFVQEGSSQTLSNDFDYPVVNGVRRIILTGSPGCTTNAYQYSLVANQ